MNPLKDWNRFLFGPISARPLGAFRIVFGLLILIYLGLMTVEFDQWYTHADGCKVVKLARGPVLDRCVISPLAVRR